MIIEEGTESILEEAQRLTHGSRNQDYGHPLDDYTRTAALQSALLAHKLKEPLTAHESALLQACVKLSREMNVQKRDNMVDLAGYAWVARACLEETQRRAAAALDTISDDRTYQSMYAVERGEGQRGGNVEFISAYGGSQPGNLTMVGTPRNHSGHIGALGYAHIGPLNECGVCNAKPPYTLPYPPPVDPRHD